MKGSRLLLSVIPLAALACGGGAEPEVEEATAATVMAEARAATDSTTDPGVLPEAAADTVSDTMKPLLRETYAWTGGGRDPFRPLLTTERGGPEFPDLELTAVIFSDSDPDASLAMFRESGSKRRHTVNPGDMIGRLYVVRINPGSVTLRMNDFGTVREQTYSLRGSGDENQ